MATTNHRPKARSVVMVIEALRANIPSEPPSFVQGVSEKGRAYVRYQAVTNSIPWHVDIYQGNFYRVRVGTGTGEIRRSIPTLIGYIARKLGY